MRMTLAVEQLTPDPIPDSDPNPDPDPDPALHESDTPVDGSHRSNINDLSSSWTKLYNSYRLDVKEELSTWLVDFGGLATKLEEGQSRRGRNVVYLPPTEVKSIYIWLLRSHFQNTAVFLISTLLLSQYRHAVPNSTACYMHQSQFLEEWESSVPTETLRAYRKTNYLIRYEGKDYCLRVGKEIDSELLEVFRSRDVHSLLFITAWNPQSVPLSLEENSIAQAALINDLYDNEVDFFPECEGCEGIDISDDVANLTGSRDGEEMVLENMNKHKRDKLWSEDSVAVLNVPREFGAALVI